MTSSVTRPFPRPTRVASSGAKIGTARPRTNHPSVTKRAARLADARRACFDAVLSATNRVPGRGGAVVANIRAGRRTPDASQLRVYEETLERSAILGCPLEIVRTADRLLRVPREQERFILDTALEAIDDLDPAA